MTAKIIPFPGHRATGPPGHLTAHARGTANPVDLVAG